LSQRHVEQVIGKLVTDEDFRREFTRDPVALLRGLLTNGAELNEVEVRALAGLDPRRVERFAESLDPRLLKCCLHASREGR
jgi:hypothetical protein